MSVERAGVPANFDLIIVGAGINGAGIARDAALRGLRVLLLDKGDVASGTTSWSTRLIHGGLRYLEHGEIRLVRESLRERERLLRIAPHLVRPLPLMIPIYGGDRRGPLLIRAGMLAYDALSFDKSLPRHTALDRAAVLRAVPGLNPDGLRGAVRYFDAQVEYPERLALENALDARKHGAQIRTYHQVDRIVTAGPRVTGVEGRDVLTGEPFWATAPIVLNVTGPWVDEVLAGTGARGPERLVGGTKGSHIVVGPFPGAPATALYAEARRDGRPFFIIPWNDSYLIGTTDIRYSGNLDDVVAEEWEIDLLLDETNSLIPAARLNRECVFYAYAGVRPLPHAPQTSEGSVTRRHVLRDHAEHGGAYGLYSVIGGKLTTYRELAEQAVDLVLWKLGRTAPSQTAEIPLPGARSESSWPEFRSAFIRESGLHPRSAEHLLEVYGTQAAEVLRTANTPELREIVDPWSGAIAAEVPWAFQVEGARTLADVLARRSMVGLGPELGIGAVDAMAQTAVTALGWDTERAIGEAAAYREWVRRYRPRELEPESSGANTYSR